MAYLEKRLPPMNTLVAFEAAFRHRNFTRAAEELHLTQASISRLIRQLEQGLNTRLFERGRRDVTPTPAGEVLAETVRRTLGDLAMTADLLRGESRNSETLTVFSELVVASLLIAPCIGAFQHRYPDLTIRVFTSSEPLEAFDKDFDVGLRSGRWAEHSYLIEPVADDAIFPVCAPKLLQSLGGDITAETILSCPLLHLAQAGGPWPDWKQFLHHIGVPPPPTLKGPSINSYDVLLDFAENGEGLALGWARSVKARIDAGRLVRIPNMLLPLPDHIAAHYSKRARPNPIAREFVALLRETASPLDDFSD
ncbi:MAG: LysR substrate-binding domain-containing protein [Alphaproteobacteria bacterium]